MNQIALVDDVRDLMDRHVTHSAFPVVAETAQGNVHVGLILKSTLREILRHSGETIFLFVKSADQSDCDIARISCFLTIMMNATCFL